MPAVSRLRRRFRDRGNPLVGPLGRKLLGWLLLFSLLPLFASNALGYLRSQAIIQSLVERYLKAIAEVEAEHISGEVLRQQLDLKAIVAGNEFLLAGVSAGAGGMAGLAEVATPEALHTYLARKAGELGIFDELMLLDGEGGVVASSEVGPRPGRRAGRVAVLSERLEPVATVHLLEPMEGPGPEGPRFRIAAPLENADGATVGYLAGVIGHRGLSGLVEIPGHLAGTVESTIVDRHGHPLYVSAGRSDRGYGVVVSSPALESSPGTFARYRDGRGVEVVATTATVPGASWRYLAEVPVTDVLGPLRNLRRVSLVLGLLLAAALMVTAWVVAGGMVGPVRRLVGATRRVGAGELDVRVDIDTGDEIGELGAAFNEMTEELVRASRRVRELHRREIERAQQLATVGELASGVAHEIKNPLVGISNGLDLVQRHVGEHEELTPIMSEMQHQLVRMEGAVRDLLAFARPATPSLARVEANGIVERASRLVQPAADRAGVGVEVRLHPASPEVEVDAELIRQALVNLLMNAVHATPAGGRIEVVVLEGEGAVRLQIRDSGRGIRADDMDHIFKPFYTTRHSGTGLGLSITREIVERHGGRVEVASAPGEGSTFTVVLPVPGGGDDVGGGG